MSEPIEAVVARYVEDREERIMRLERAYAKLYETAFHQAAVVLRAAKMLGPERLPCARYLEQRSRDVRVPK